MRHNLLLSTILIGAAGIACAADAPVQIDAKNYASDVRYLASDKLKGRATGSPELEMAAAYIQKQFISAGLKPVPGHSYQQEYTVTLGAHLGPQNQIQAKMAGHTAKLAVGSSFTPFSSSSSGTATNLPVVFAGYGITAKDLGYDDYAGLDVKDKFVLILRHEPQENDPKSVFDGQRETSHSTFTNKAVNAKMHGARGVIIVNDTANHPGQRDSLLSFAKSSGPTDAGVLFVQITAKTAEAWLAGAEPNHRTISSLIQAIDNGLKPQSFPLPDVTVSMKLEIVHESKVVHNVAAYIPGSTNEYVIIGAHYDHLGLGDENSLAPSQIGQIHHGADDNASGTGGVLELAKWFSKQPQPKRGILFITFSGEELGLLGSSYYVTAPLLPLADAVTMINMDMIGRIPKDGKVSVLGTGTGSTLDRIVKATPAPASLKIDMSESTGYGGSDHISFQAKKIPVIFFFSGLHGDYHKPSDTFDKINVTGAVDLLGYIAQITDALLAAPDRPTFQQVAEPANAHSGGAVSSSGYGPNFGSVPDFNEPPKGVRFADVRAGTPAAKAGLKAGDILIEFDGKEIANLYDFTYALQAHKPGDEVPVKVLRGTQSIEAKVLLTQRN